MIPDCCGFATVSEAKTGRLVESHVNLANFLQIFVKLRVGQLCVDLRLRRPIAKPFGGNLQTFSHSDCWPE